MKKILYYAAIILSLWMAGCAQELIYRADFDANKRDYYEARLTYEREQHEKSIAGIQQVGQEAKELCSVLYHRMPSKRDQYNILAIGLKSYRLEKSIETIELMREHFYSAFRLTFNREDLADDILKVQFNLEIKQMEDFLVHLAELHARIIYLDRFRQETTLKTEIQEEKIENFQILFRNANTIMKDMVYKKMTGHFTNVGIAVTKNPKYQLLVTQRKLDDKLEDEAVLFPSASNPDDVSDYEYYFAEQKEKFDEHFTALKSSVDRFRKAIDSYKQDAIGGHSYTDNANIAIQLDHVTAVMENALEKIETLFGEIQSDLQSLVGGRESIDSTLWTKVKRETQDVAEKDNFSYYQSSVVDLSNDLRSIVSLDNESSEAKRLQNTILNMEKHFNQTQGVWGTGYDFLSQEWQQKISFKTLSEQFAEAVKGVEETTKDGLRPLWMTCNMRYKGNNRPPYALKDGYLFKNE